MIPPTGAVGMIGCNDPSMVLHLPPPGTATLNLTVGAKVTNPTKFTWTDPTLNVDGTPIAPGEITGYQLGLRTSGIAGTYPILVPVAGATAASELMNAISPALAPATYFAAIQAVGPVDSAWSAEVTFTIAPEQPMPPIGLGTS